MLCEKCSSQQKKKGGLQLSVWPSAAVRTPPHTHTRHTLRVRRLLLITAHTHRPSPWRACKEGTEVCKRLDEVMQANRLRLHFDMQTVSTAACRKHVPKKTPPPAPHDLSEGHKPPPSPTSLSPLGTFSQGLSQSAGHRRSSIREEADQRRQSAFAVTLP